MPASMRGETIALAETAAGVFTGTVPLERVYGEDGGALAIGFDGKIAVYAEGGVATASIAVRYCPGCEGATGGLGKQAVYSEPPSTVTSLVRIAGVVKAGALVQLLSSSQATRSTASRADGSFAFHDVPSGNYTLVADARGGQKLSTLVTVP